MNKLLLCLLIVFFSTTIHAQNPPKREVRGAWIATFSNIDWPTRTQTPAQQRAALITILDHHKATGINAIYFQVRSQCDAMYPSSIEPWSADLTGTQGKAPSVFWDPMQFALEECHKRGMEFHAWINPYRAISNTGNQPGFAANHVVNQHPEWMLTQGTLRVLNPGLPAVRDYIITIITDILQRYDIDGIHFDDYFYPPTSGVGYNDDAAFNADSRGFTVRTDWRRDNVSLLIQRVYQTVKDLKPWVKFGVSPSGIYRNSTDPNIGSPTSGSEHYSVVYADSKKWLQQGWVDYIEPQVYWYMGQPGANYTLIVPWWNKNSFGRHIYIGMAGYKVNDAAQGAPWTQPSHFPNEVRLNRSNANISGQGVYNTTSLRATTRLGFRDSLRLFFYQKPALQPTMPWRDDTPPAPATALQATKYGNDSVVLNWTKPPEASTELDKAKRFVVYRSNDPAIDINDANNILIITPNDTTAFADKTIAAGTRYYYTITALDRFQNESAISNIVADAAPVIECPANTELHIDASCSVVLPDYTGVAAISNAASVAQSPAPGTVLNTGTWTITLTAANEAGQIAACSFNVTVADKTPPTITGPVGNGATVQRATDPGQCTLNAGHAFDITAADHCSNELTYSYTLAHNGTTSQPITSATLQGVLLEKGLTTVSWTVTDEAGNVATYNYTIQVSDEELPVITTCAESKTVSTDPGKCYAIVNAGMSLATDNCGVTGVVGKRSDNKALSDAYQKGTTTILWTIKDEAGNTVTCEQAITVEDREPPVITGASTNPSSLFPPNHKMKKVTVAYNVADNCGGVTTVLSVSSNEPENGTGDGDTENDWEILDNHHVMLRAERAGSGDGRIYTITITATDGAGNVSTQDVIVTVPHDRNSITKTQQGTSENTVQDLEVTALPNPARDQFALTVRSGSNKPLLIKVSDNNGRIVETRQGMVANGTIYLGARYAAGIYYVTIMQGSDKQVLKLVKQ